MAESNISIESETNTARRGEDFSGKIQDDFAPNNQHWPIGTRQGERNQFHNGGFNPITNFSTTFDELCKFIDRACPPSSMVPLSSSVDVTHTIEQLTSSHPIELEYALESEYKPRYKSDYFPQSGNVRPPRFVTDCNGKNYVTLQILPDLAGYIRVDWVTVEDRKGVRYSMPYKFQINHKENDDSDINSILFQIPNNGNEVPMKFQLALIKSKQDELAHVQPLQVFPATTTSVQPNAMQQILPPKDLIREYQLNRSQLAFTYCTINTDGSHLFYENTTVYSTIMTEQLSTPNKTQNVSCPKCHHRFEINTDNNKTH